MCATDRVACPDNLTFPLVCRSSSPWSSSLYSVLRPRAWGTYRETSCETRAST